LRISAKAAEKAGADAEKKLATASSKIKQLEGKVKVHILQKLL
jgi:hypothetical protein